MRCVQRLDKLERRAVKERRGSVKVLGSTRGHASNSYIIAVFLLSTDYTDFPRDPRDPWRQINAKSWSLLKS